MTTRPAPDPKVIPAIAAVRTAAVRLRQVLAPSRVIRSDALSAAFGVEVLFKLELENPTGSFKVRGAYNVLAGLSAEERVKGVVASATLAPEAPRLVNKLFPARTKACSLLKFCRTT